SANKLFSPKRPIIFELLKLIPFFFKTISLTPSFNAISNLLDKNGPTGINSKIINIEGNRAFIIRVEKYKPEVMQEF
ncbi:MAG: hypothetical protein ACTS82_01230, partial [Arsenophonus sp. ET-DL12-MAG3]